MRSLTPVDDGQSHRSPGAPRQSRPGGPGGRAHRCGPQARSSLDPTGTLGTRPDSGADYAYRNAVADVLGPVWRERAAAMRDCGHAGVKMLCLHCGRMSVFPARCGARTCPTCARRAWLMVVQRAEERLALFDLMQLGQAYEGPGAPQRLSYKLLTLTVPVPHDRAQPFDPDALRDQVCMIRKAFRRFWRKTIWGRQIPDPITGRRRSRRDTAFILALEIGQGGNVHLHVLVYGEYVPQAHLQNLWSEVVGEQLAIVDVREARHRAGALRYCLKYLLKAAGSARPRPEHAAAVEYALRRVRRVEMGGALWGATAAGESPVSGEDVSGADLTEAERGACASCGKSGSWSWKGRADPSEVAALGGFSLRRLEAHEPPVAGSGPDPTDEERRAQRDGE